MLYILCSHSISPKRQSILLFVMSTRGCFSLHFRRLVSQEPVAEYSKPLLGKHAMRKVKSGDDAMSVEVPSIECVNRRTSSSSTTRTFLSRLPSPRPTGTPNRTFVIYPNLFKRRNHFRREPHLRRNLPLVLRRVPIPP